MKYPSLAGLLTFPAFLAGLLAAGCTASPPEKPPAAVAPRDAEPIPVTVPERPGVAGIMPPYRSLNAARAAGRKYVEMFAQAHINIGDPIEAGEIRTMQDVTDYLKGARYGAAQQMGDTLNAAVKPYVLDDAEGTIRDKQAVRLILQRAGLGMAGR